MAWFKRRGQHDPKDRLTGYTIITREAEWTDQERMYLLALSEYDSGICNCGFHESLTSDTDNYFTFEDKNCPVCAGAAQRSRRIAEDDERGRESLKASGQIGRDPADGRRSFVRMMGPDEVARVEAKRAMRREKSPSLEG